MLAKIIAWGATRTEALHRLRQALQELVLLGVGTNQSMLLDLIEEPWVQRGETFTHTLETWSWSPPAMPEIYKTLQGIQNPSYRHGIKTHADHLVGALCPGSADIPSAYKKISSPQGTWISDRGRVYLIPPEESTSSRKFHHKHGVIAPMTGKIVAIHVHVGKVVNEGQVVAILEAMKMEYRLTAPHEGMVSQIACAVGTLVDFGQPILTIDPVGAQLAAPLCQQDDR
jgi:acetyl/propionyl-CoA carboxylase alpha subunit